MDMKPRMAPAARSRFPDGFRILQGKREYVTYIERSSVRVWYSDEARYYESHFHSAVEIIVPLRGEVRSTLLDGSYHVQAGEVLIVPPNCSHDLDMGENSARDLLLFEPSSIFSMRDMPLIDELLQQPVYLTAESPLTTAVRSLLLQAVECYNRREPMWNSMCYAYLMQMYVRIGQDYLSRSMRPEPVEHRVDTEIVDSARLYVDQNYMRDIDLSDVAAFSGFSKYYFSRMFKQQLGISFSEYLRQKRVGVAEERLIHSDQSIQDIAVAAGFGSIATFNRVFKEAKNCTPSKYREIYSDFI
ncbi:MAG: helix-turn-helix transcriptional regulator [Clostridia bacterium]|nr:helix-turn-helix transcriptional regulator [Clostridia bacterium]MBO4885955.1 helix-turn-helix transcriptional regulator [Clostridia bacterium]MBR4443383.1 helix-turn-helix transcriptional regulator [Clostridia bacterium]